MGTVAKAGAAAARTFPKTAELAANIGGKAGDLKLNMATSLNTKITSLGEKIAIPKFGPQPALAGAGGRGSNVFEMTPGTRTGSSAHGLPPAKPVGSAPANAPDPARLDTAPTSDRPAVDSQSSSDAAIEGGADVAPAEVIPPPSEGASVWRVYGEAQDAAGVGMRRGSLPYGESWTPRNPELSSDFRRDAGLPDENPGRYVIEGRLVRPENVAQVRPALPLDGQPGGWPEYLIKHADDSVEVVDVRGVNEPWTKGLGDWSPPTEVKP